MGARSPDALGADRAFLERPTINIRVRLVLSFLSFVLFAMAYIEGESLGERIRRRGPLAPPAATSRRCAAWGRGTRCIRCKRHSPPTAARSAGFARRGCS